MVRELKAQLGGHNRVRTVQEVPFTYPKERMDSADHVTGDAARDYTAKVAALLSAQQ